MSNLVKQSQLSQVALALWEKVKERMDANDPIVSINHWEAGQGQDYIIFNHQSGKTSTISMMGVVQDWSDLSGVKEEYVNSTEVRYILPQYNDMTCVEMEFISTTGLSSQTVRAAIDEINTKLEQNYVSLNQVGNEANKIPLIESNGKLATSIIPEIAINRVLTVADKDEAITKFGEGEEELQTGDVVIIASEQNSLFMFNGTEITDVADFDTAFIQLTIGEGTVKSVNGETPDATGTVTLALEVDQTNDNIELTLGDQSVMIECMTDTEVQAIINQFV